MRTIISVTIAAFASSASPLLAQTLASAQAAQPSAGGTPDVMPFDIPYGMSIDLERAKQVMAAAKAEAKRRNWKMNISVVIPTANWCSSSAWKTRRSRRVRIQWARREPQRASGRSRGCSTMHETGHPYAGTLDPTLAASPGGFPRVENGKLIGAVGCSGGTGDQDAAFCKVGADVVK
jgi:glc operon protein GlcG